MAALQKLWVETVSEFYPQTEDTAQTLEKGPDQVEQFKEDKVDQLIKQKL